MENELIACRAGRKAGSSRKRSARNWTYGTWENATPRSTDLTETLAVREQELEQAQNDLIERNEAAERLEQAGF